MIKIISNYWALFSGLFLLLVGNGLQGSLLGIRSQMEGFSPLLSGIIMSAYFAGFLVGVFWASSLIRRVGHIRVFAAMASIASAAILLMGLWISPVGWFLLRFVIGVSFAAVYVVVESWINSQATNESRGQLLSVYTIVTVVGALGGQAFLNVASPSTIILFVVASILVSIGLIPLLLTAAPAPPFEQKSDVTLVDIFRASPVGFMGTLFSGFLIGSYLSYSPVFAADQGLSTINISLFMAAIFVAGGLTPWPLGRMSDYMDRRLMIAIMMAVTTFLCWGAAQAYHWQVIGTVTMLGFYVLAASTAFSLYGISIAYTNDNLAPEQMVGASAILLLVNAAGAILGPIGSSVFQTVLGPSGPLIFIGCCTFMLLVFVLYRMNVREAPPLEDRTIFSPNPVRGTVVVTSMVQENAMEREA
ncbi:MAG: MFS transporter [Alphaproteobacteria bacterium]